MFEIARLQDTVHIQPAEFRVPPLTAITDALSEKYPNKVVPGLGLCIALYDITAVGESQLYPGSAAHHTFVEFRLVIFRPYVGEVLSGQIVSCDEHGVRLSLGFFDEIYCPSHLLQYPSSWSPEERVWVWDVPGTEHQLFFDVQNSLRFRVEEVHFHEPSNESAKAAAADGAGGGPGTPGVRGAARGEGATAHGQGLRATSPQTTGKKHAAQPAMQILASMDRSGLGLTSWWPPDESLGLAE